jgi:hypothetical protein
MRRVTSVECDVAMLEEVFLSRKRVTSERFAQVSSVDVIISQFAIILISMDVNSRGHLGNRFIQAYRPR